MIIPNNSNRCNLLLIAYISAFEMYNSLCTKTQYLNQILSLNNNLHGYYYPYDTDQGTEMYRYGLVFPGCQNQQMIAIGHLCCGALD